MIGRTHILRFIVEKPLSLAQAEDFLHTIEKIIDSIDLMWENCADNINLWQRIENRKSWLEKNGRLENSWFLSSDRTNSPVVGAGLICLPAITIRGCDLAPYTAILAVEANMDLDLMDFLVAAMGDVLKALHCTYDSYESGAMLAFGRMQKLGKVSPNVYKMFKQYPFLKAIPKSKIWTGNPTHAQLVEVSKIGWINYWSKETASRAGLTDESIISELPFYKLRKTEHGWYFRLTKEPLDLAKSEHVETFLAAHKVFPNVGVRKH